MGTDEREPDDHQSAVYGGDEHPQCVCGSDRVDEYTFQEQREHHSECASA